MQHSGDRSTWLGSPHLLFRDLWLLADAMQRYLLSLFLRAFCTQHRAPGKASRADPLSSRSALRFDFHDMSDLARSLTPSPPRNSSGPSPSNAISPDATSLFAPSSQGPSGSSASIPASHLPFPPLPPAHHSKSSPSIRRTSLTIGDPASSSRRFQDGPVQDGKGKGRMLGIQDKLKSEIDGVVKRRDGGVLARGCARLDLRFAKLMRLPCFSFILKTGRSHIKVA